MTTMNNVELAVDSRQITCSLQNASENLTGADGELPLDFSSMLRIDSSALRALEDLIRLADEKNVKVVLCKVNVDVYKVLKLMGIASRFSYRS